MKDAAAIILCAGKGTRMNDDSQNKVCFDCAGTPVIRRIIDNMRAGGVRRFVIVVGHHAVSVMDALGGVDGVVYAYQKEQKGTGHAALCGLNALDTVGYAGSVIVSMGDKIIAPRVIEGLLKRAENARAVWGVQPLAANYSGGRVAVADGKPCGVVEFADAAYMALADAKPEEYGTILARLGLNEKKAEKVIAAARRRAPRGTRTIAGRTFTAEEILHTPYANAGLYCFDAQAAARIIRTLGADNAQGEIYLTDALEAFASEGGAEMYEITAAEDMLTYSTKPELREMSRHFLRSASDYLRDIASGAMDAYFDEIYPGAQDAQKARYLKLLDTFLAAYGDRRAVITRSPGRINLMGRHIDHRGGSINVMATDRDTVFVCAPRGDDTVRMTNTDPAYPDRTFSIGGELARAKGEKGAWLDYLNDESVKAALDARRGDWSNYVMGALLRAQWTSDMPLCGMDLAADGNIPVAAGLSSSSSLVVAAMEAAAALNCLHLSASDFIGLCGEGEWFVGSRGGAGDHAAMKCGRRDQVIGLGFKPFTVGGSAPFSDRYAVIVANSMIRARKSEGSRDVFNAKVAAYELALLLLKRSFPEYGFAEFRDLADVTPNAMIYRMLKTLPEKATRDEVRRALPGSGEAIERIFATHADPGEYDLRGVALYGVSECVRARRCMALLCAGDYAALGAMMKISHDGDRLTGLRVTDELLDRLAAEDADPAMQSGAYACSTAEIDRLCDLLNGTDGVLGCELVGAGLGGCVIALAEKDKAESVLSVLTEKYYTPGGYAPAAQVFTASAGSSVLY